MRLALGSQREPLGAVNLVDDDLLPVEDLPSQQHAGQAVADLALDEAAQWPGPVGGVVALVGQPAAGGVGDLQVQAPVRQALGDARQLDLDDLTQLLLGEGLEDDDVVEAIEELRLEEA